MGLVSTAHVWNSRHAQLVGWGHGAALNQSFNFILAMMNVDRNCFLASLINWWFATFVANMLMLPRCYWDILCHILTCVLDWCLLLVCAVSVTPTQFLFSFWIWHAPVNMSARELQWEPYANVGALQSSWFSQNMFFSSVSSDSHLPYPIWILIFFCHV